jgi:superfamily II DNA/RNA helicase
MKDEISMDRVTYFVLDEGDRMLEEGFESQVKVIANAIRPDRHMLFFSATWPMQVHRLAKKMCTGSRPPVRLRVGQNSDGTAKTRDDIVQEVVVFEQKDWDERDRTKKELLYAHVREALELDGTKVLVFVSRKDLCDEMSYQFNGWGFEAEAMHGGKTQDGRLATLDRFKNGDTRLLATTDVMGRGLDIPTITHVVVYDMGDIEDYVHRIGRTARGPQGEGHALTLFEYDPRWPHLAEGLIKVMEQSNQEVPEELRTIAEEVKEGKRATKAMKGKFGALSGNQGSFEQIQKKTYGNKENALATW